MEAAGGRGLAAPARGSWRQRHPRGARVLLYGVLLLVLVGTILLWRDARQRYLLARVEQASVLVALDPSGATALQALDAEFRALGPLEPLLQGGALRAREARMRAVIASLRKDRAGMDEAFARAAAWDPEASRSVALERATCLLRLGDAAAAGEALPRPLHRAGEGWAHAVWAMLVHAQVQEAAGRGAASRAALRAALGTLPRPLPREPAQWIALAPIHAELAVLEATRWLVGPGPAAPSEARLLWLQLVEVAAGDAPVVVSAAASLLALGDTEGARAALRVAWRADPRAASDALAAQPSLQALAPR